MFLEWCKINTISKAGGETGSSDSSPQLILEIVSKTKLRPQTHLSSSRSLKHLFLVKGVNC